MTMWLTGLGLGLALGIGVGWYAASRRLARLLEQALREGERAQQLTAQVDGLRQTLAQRDDERLRLTAEVARLQATQAAEAEKLLWTERHEQRLRDAFDALAASALRANAESFGRQTREQLDGLLNQVRGDWSTQKEQFAGVVQPVAKSLQRLDEQVRLLEQKREGAYQGLQQHLADLQKAQGELRSETGHLRSALTTSTRVRGKWGELQLRRLVEMALMVEHVDFEEQTGSGDQRPDMLVHLPNGGLLPVDAKTPMDHFLAAAATTDDTVRRDHLRGHAAALRSHVTALGQKAYWKQFARAPEVVVMYVPNEACLSAAFDENPQLLEDGLRQHVLLATPVSLYGLLRAVAFGWQQQAITDNARAIADEGKALSERLGVFLGHLQKTGRSLDATVRAFNETVGSAESRLMPSARRLRDLKATERELEGVSPLDQLVRQSTGEDGAGSPV